MRHPRRTLKDYQADLRLLRRYYTGFDPRHGFNSRKLSDSAKKKIREWAPQIKQLRAIKQYPHIELKGKSKKAKLGLENVTPVQPESLTYQVAEPGRRRKVTVKGYTRKVGRKKIRVKGYTMYVRTRKRVRTVTPGIKVVPVFTTDAKAKVNVNKDGSLRIEENGHVRDVYAIDRKAFALDPYAYMREFMRKHRAVAVTLNVSGNVIGETFRWYDFVDERERQRLRDQEGIRLPSGSAVFVNIVEKYREKDPARADSFIAQIGAVSVLRGGARASADFTNQVKDAREQLKADRRFEKMSKRARATGRR